MSIEDLSPDVVEKVKACKTPEEMRELAEEAGYKLTDEELHALSGGEHCSDWEGCPQWEDMCLQFCVRVLD